MRHAWLPLVVAASLASAISCAGTSSSAVPPTRICGKTLYNGALGLMMFDLWGKAGVTPPPAPPTSDPVTIQSGFASVLVRVAPGCAEGASLSIHPANALVIDNRVLAKDGRPTAVALQGGAPGPATLAATVGNKTQIIHFNVR